MKEADPLPHKLSPCSSGRRTSCGDSNSPEFEFWMVRNPSFPQPNLLSADELFSGGVLLPLHHLHLSDGPPPSQPEPSESAQAPDPEPETESSDLSATSSLTSSKRWRDIFRKNDTKSSKDEHCTKEKDVVGLKEKRREKKSGAGNGASAAELNINIWPFSRSRSAGNGGTRPRSTASASRKVSSAPCSRSNSRGESKSRKWPSSPGRAGVHLGRSSPVWQVRRTGGGGRIPEVSGKSGDVVKKDGNEGRQKIPVGGGAKGRVLSLNVPMCIGYRQQLSCRSDENSADGIAAAGVVGGGGQNGGRAAGEGVRGSNLFNFKSLFTRKVY